MESEVFNLKNAPIVEAIIDIDCDMPADFLVDNIASLAIAKFGSAYPKRTTQNVLDFHVALPLGVPPSRQQRSQVQAYRFHSDDEKQLVQVRVNGFTFNRLAPYVSLDDYLPEIEARWMAYISIANPVIVREIRLRYLNVIRLPIREEVFNMEEYIKIAPRLPYDDGGLVVGAFANQLISTEQATNHVVRISLTNQTPNPIQYDDNGDYVVILDIEASSKLDCEPNDWPTIVSKVIALRQLKNRVFKESLTPKCLQLFQ